MKIKKNIIAAVADNLAIGKDNSLLWHISEDLKFFKKTTLGCTVIMGRKTFESIGRPLPGRINIVVTRTDRHTFSENVLVAHSLEEAFVLAESAEKDCIVLGGGEIYRQALPLVNHLYITKVHTIIEDADTFFPEIDQKLWNEISSSGKMKNDETGYEFEFITYERKI